MKSQGTNFTNCNNIQLVKVVKDGGSTLKHFDASIKHHFEGKNLNHGPNGPSKSIAKNSPM